MVGQVGNFLLRHLADEDEGHGLTNGETKFVPFLSSVSFDGLLDLVVDGNSIDEDVCSNMVGELPWAIHHLEHVFKFLDINRFSLLTVLKGVTDRFTGDGKILNTGDDTVVALL